MVRFSIDNASVDETNGGRSAVAGVEDSVNTAAGPSSNGARDDGLGGESEDESLRRRRDVRAKARSQGHPKLTATLACHGGAPLEMG